MDLSDDIGGPPGDITAFRHLVRVVGELVEDPARQKALTLAAWSLVHGLASLLVGGPLRGLASDPERVRTLAESTVSTMSYPLFDAPGQRN